MKKRFIAGAVCPRCGELDRIVMLQPEEGPRQRACVACGFHESLAELDATELPTRVNQPRVPPQPKAEAKGVQEQVIRFFPTSRNKDPS